MRCILLVIASCAPAPDRVRSTDDFNLDGRPGETGDSGPSSTLHDTGAGPEDTGDDEQPHPPYEQELLLNGGFEEPDLAGWEPSGHCALTASTATLAPAEGERFLRGAEGNTPEDCLLVQQIDLEASGFDLAAIDRAEVVAELEGLVANHGPAGSFDDQLRLRLRYLDDAGEWNGSLETLVAGDGEWTLRGATGLVPPGTRSLAVEVEGRMRSLPDNDAFADALSLRLRPVEPASPTITLSPLLQDYRTDTMRLAWETDGRPALHRVLYAESGGPLEAVEHRVRTIAVDEGHHVHVVELSGLSPATGYDYLVQSGATESDLHRFHTAPSPETDAPVSIGWLADNQEGWERFRTHLGHLSARAPDLLVVPGDIVHEHDRLSEWREWWWGPLVDEASFGSQTPVLVARGNHDLHHPYAYAYVLLPGNEVFYSFRYGPVFVVVLDSQISPAHMPDSIDQRYFLEQALQSEEARTADFRVVTFHQAPYTNAVQHETTGSEGAREHWVPLFEEYGVDLVVSGHFHSYQRGELNGVHYLIVGGGGSSLLQDVYDFWDHMTILELSWHYSTMEVEGGRLSWKTWDLDDTLLDSFEIESRSR